MNNDKCEFCKGAGKEPGEPGCVWCLNTGTKEGQALLTPPDKRHQGEPVALPDQKELVKAWGHDMGGNFEEGQAFGWNAFRDEIAKLGPLYSRPVQGEPVAYADPKSFENFKAMAHLGGLYLHEWMWAEAKPGMVPLYTHADPAEVERLREQLHDLAMAMHKRHYAKTAPDFEPFDFASGLIGQIDNMVAGILQDVSTLRADVETMRRKNNEYWHESEAMRTQLGEAQALLSEWRRTWGAQYRRDAAILLKTDALLSASAEPEVKS